MIKASRIQDNWTWVSPLKRISKYGGCNVGAKVEIRSPIYAIYSSSDEDVYFVNNSKETLKRVIAARSFDWPLSDENIILSYDNVLPGESVLIDNYDTFYDSDYLIQQIVFVEEKFAVKSFSVTSYGHVINESILQWDNDEGGKNANMRTYPE